MLCMRGALGKRQIFVADVEQLENLDASQNHARRLKANEVLLPRHGEDFVVHFANGSVMDKIDRALRMPTSSQEHVAREEEHNDVLLGESDGSSDGSHLLDQRTSSVEDRNDFWSVSWNEIHRHHDPTKSLTST